MNVVGIGGGHGLSRVLAALRGLGHRPTAVVTVADDGGSSGRLRHEHGVVALGDMRVALSTLAEHGDLADLVNHRFSGGDLDGHALGNLMLLALLDLCDGDLVAAVDRAAALLRCHGRVLPAATHPLQLRGWIGGREVGGQVSVATADEPVERVWVEPEVPACDDAVVAIKDAEVVVLGPGSLFTSVLAALVVPGVGEAVTASAARVVYVANLLTQPGETSELDAAGHVDALVRHVPGLELAAVVLHDGPTPHGAGRPIGTAVSHPAVERVVTADLALRSPAGTVTGMHDPDRLGRALQPLLAG